MVGILDVGVGCGEADIEECGMRIKVRDLTALGAWRCARKEIAKI